jgi:hypothetical protein
MVMCGGARAQEMLLPNMPLHDPFIQAYAPTKTSCLYTPNGKKRGSRVARMSTSQNRDMGHPILWLA